MTQNDKADLIVTACYYPKIGKADITFEHKEYNKRCSLEDISLTPEQGQALAETVMACIYHTANIKAHTQNDKAIEELRKLKKWLYDYVHSRTTNSEYHPNDPDFIWEGTLHDKIDSQIRELQEGK